MNQQINQLLTWQPNAQLLQQPLVGPEQHRQGMRYFASGVSIIASGSLTDPAGLTATAVCSVTADPPRLVVFVNKEVQAAKLILATGALSVNLLAADQEQEAKVFAGMVPTIKGADRFKQGSWQQKVTGAPVLEQAAASFDCRVIKVFDESTHYAFLSEVLAVEERPNCSVLLYLNGAFRQLPV